MTEWLNVSDITPRIGYTATASQTAFTVPFAFFEDGDLSVYQNGTLLALDVDYTVTGAEEDDGGTVDLTTGATVGDEIMISRHVPIEQTTHIPPSGPLDVPAINIQFSKLVAMIQQVADGVDRSVRLSDDSFGELQPSEPVAGEYLKWNATADGVESTAIVTPDGSYAIATKSEAEAGALNDVLMTPLRTAEAIAALATRTFDTRSQAISEPISADIDIIRTLAYDSSFTANSGALFKRVASGTPFTDTWPLTGSITGGSGYVNGTYYGVALTGVGAAGLGLVATITVSGGAVTAVDHSCQPGNAYNVSDAISCANTSLGGTGAGFVYTITSISSPRASFINTVDNSRWQYLPSKGRPHVNEFGAKPDFVALDASATNNFPAIQGALFYAAYNPTGTSTDSGGYAGDVVWAGVGSYMLQQAANTDMLVIPNGVFLEGCYGTTLKFHAGWYAATHCIVWGNPNAHFANFNCGLRRLNLFFPGGVSVALGTYMIYANNPQDRSALESVEIVCGERGALKYEIGYGGASMVRFTDLTIKCQGATQAVDMNVGTTIMICHDWSVNAPSSGTNNTAYAISVHGTGGMYDFQNVHCEGFNTCGFIINITNAAGQASFKNCTGGFNQEYLFELSGTNVAGNASFERCQRNNGSGLGLVLNGQGGGSTRAADILPKDGIVFFNP